ncbi:MAG: ABC transporter permease [Fibrobacter sp.]|nr:ABC transporter permease [Fibrobacter sp.]
MGTLFYFIHETFRGLFAAKVMTFVSIITIGASLFFMSIIGIGIYNINGLLKQTGNQADIAVYLKDDVSSKEDSVAVMLWRIKQDEKVKNAVFISKDSAVKKFTEMYGGEMLDAVNGNPLPASFDVYIVDRYRSNKDIRELQEQIQMQRGVESVRYSKEWIDLVERFRVYFLVGAVLLITLMVLVLHIMITNSIKLTIYARQELVKNMLLVGATRFFINTPFILEGMIQGLFGACTGLFALTIVKITFANVPVLWGPSYVPALFLLTGAFFGWIGSMSAVRKFLV